MNGVNNNSGGNSGNAAGAVMPAGYQAELNYIWSLVEELSKQLAENRKKNEEIGVNIGKLRQQAKDSGTTTDDILAAAANGLSAQNVNYETQISVLEEALDKAKYSRDSNMALLQEYRTIMLGMLQQFHTYKAQHIVDVCSWHNSYRNQLAEARQENCRLREQMWGMQTHASKAHGQLRKLRRVLADDESRHERHAKEVAYRQELRFWKRMAMPHIPDDDPMWSDDDDLIDPQEKIRLRAVHAEQAANLEEQDSFNDGAMIRDGGNMAPQPLKPSPMGDRSNVDPQIIRPPSAGSTGSAGMSSTSFRTEATKARYECEQRERDGIIIRAQRRAIRYEKEVLKPRGQTIVGSRVSQPEIDNYFYYRGPTWPPRHYFDITHRPAPYRRNTNNSDASLMRDGSHGYKGNGFLNDDMLNHKIFPKESLRSRPVGGCNTLEWAAEGEYISDPEKLTALGWRTSDGKSLLDRRDPNCKTKTRGGKPHTRTKESPRSQALREERMSGFPISLGDGYEDLASVPMTRSGSSSAPSSASRARLLRAPAKSPMSPLFSWQGDSDDWVDIEDLPLSDAPGLMPAVETRDFALTAPRKMQRGGLDEYLPEFAERFVEMDWEGDESGGNYALASEKKGRYVPVEFTGRGRMLWGKRAGDDDKEDYDEDGGVMVTVVKVDENGDEDMADQLNGLGISATE